MIVFGLGNPLPKYKDTRHNVGFMVVDRLAKQLSLRFSHHASYDIANSKKMNVTLIKPMRYMNNSGIAVSEYLDKKEKSDASGFFIVVCDDLALPLGKIRIREKGSDGGQGGLASIIYHLQTSNFPRLRIGIGQPPLDTISTDYVLSRFLAGEKVILDKVLGNACSALMMINESGIKPAMNKYNSSDFVVGESDREAN